MPSKKKSKAKSRSQKILLPDVFPKLMEKASRYGLDILHKHLSEFSDYARGHDIGKIQAALVQMAGCQLPDSVEKTQCSLEAYCRQLDSALQLFSDPKWAEEVIKSEAKVLQMTGLLTPEGKFDIGLEAHGIQERILTETAREALEKTNQCIEKFTRTSPVDKHFRMEEPGFEEALRQSRNVLDAEDANEFGKAAWNADLNWQAELFWERAVEIDPQSHAKYWSNLALVRTHLGRFLRSHQLGFRSLGQDKIQSAIAAAEKAIAIDAKWQRAYQLAAEAHLALGAYDHAMDACRILQKALDTISSDDINSTLKNLHKMAKDRALLWCSLGVPKSKASIPGLLYVALHKLRVAVIASLPLHPDTADYETNCQVVGASIANQAALVHAICQLIYLKRDQWLRESKATGMDTNRVQLQLMQIAKLVPLHMVEKSEALKNLIFVEGPFTMWGLDRLDRAGVHSLKLEADDPCASDDIDSPQYTETLKRHSGGEAMSMSDVFKVHDWVRGPTETSVERDMAPHHLCAFSLFVFHRILRAPLLFNVSPLFWSALIKVIDFALSPTALWAGGEYTGLVLHAALGIPFYDLPEDPIRTKLFLTFPAGVVVAAIEINQSGDVGFCIQQALGSFTPSDWAEREDYEIQQVLTQYILLCMDGNLTSMTILKDHREKAHYETYAMDILSAILDGHPDMIVYFKTATPGNNLSSFRPLFASPFGVFLSRQFMAAEEKLLQQGRHVQTREVLERIAKKWGKLSKERRSAYRWESHDEETKMNLASMAPVSKMDLALARMRIQHEQDGKKAPVTKLPECESCGKGMGIGIKLFLCSCQSVRYCSEDCQRQGWKDHKKICKKLRPTRTGQK